MEDIEDFSQKFNNGDFIMHRKPYKGEGEKLIVDVDIKGKTYEAVRMKGTHVKKPNFDSREILDFDHANRCYIKVS